MEEEFVENVIELHKQSLWKEILALHSWESEKFTRKLLWAWPSESNLEFIKNEVIKFDMRGITSIGCGCGLFEWILLEATGLPVTGIEVNKNWWASRYSGPKFIDLKFLQQPLNDNSLDSTNALLFCYFNDGAAFQNYVNVYQGKMIIIVGPGDGVNRYTSPSPFHPLLDELEWQLHEHQEIKNCSDYIAVYIRIS